MKETLESFLSSIPNAETVISKHADAVAVFGYFLTEIMREPVTTAGIEACYGAARLKPPRNVSDVLSKSRSFVKTKHGWVLHRDTESRIRQLVSAGLSISAGNGDSERRRTVMVVYGQDDITRSHVFNFLRCLNLRPVEWNDAVVRTGKASPYVGEILTTAFDMAQAFLVLMTPDEEVVLRPELRKAIRDSEPAVQARPNVILEAGMALAKDESRTILVSVGPVRTMSDLDGRHVIRLNNLPERRNDLVQRLRVAGCDPATDGTDWITLGDFERWK